MTASSLVQRPRMLRRQVSTVTRGGKRPGAGRPEGAKTTGSASTRPVFYRVSAAQRAELDKAGKKRGLTGNQEAKRRAFPASPPQPTLTRELEKPDAR